MLVVDDDVRNIFALTSVLEHHKLKVVHAENGRAGIELLQRTPDVDTVLMDIMMPEMDGYETMRAIRQKPEFAQSADHRPDRESDEGRSREVHPGRAPPTTSPSRSISINCSRVLRVCIVAQDTTTATSALGR